MLIVFAAREESSADVQRDLILPLSVRQKQITFRKQLLCSIKMTR